MPTAVTVFITGADQDSRAVHNLVESWTAAGILAPSLWVTPPDVEAGQAGPPRVRAKRMTLSGTEDVDLFVEVGRHRLQLVRLIVAHHVSLDNGSDSAVSAAGRLVAEALAAALPHDRAVGSATGARLHRSVVVLPVSGTSGVDTAVLEPLWEANVVVSPEDRPDIDRASVFVRSPGNFHGHSAAALSAIGGVIEGVPDGAFDQLSVDSSGQGTTVTVARITIRAIEGDATAEELATRLISPADYEAISPAEVLPWARKPLDPEAIVRDSLRATLEWEEWRLKPEPESTVPKSHLPLLEALRVAAIFNVRTAAAVAAWALSGGRVRLERRATDVLVGSSSGTLVTLGPRGIEDLSARSAELIRTEREHWEEMLVLEASTIAPPAPSTWTSLRRLAFSLVDGGSLDGAIPTHAGKRELLDPEYVVPDVADVWTRDGSNVNPSDRDAMHAHTDLLAERSAALRGQLDSVERELASKGEAEDHQEKSGLSRERAHLRGAVAVAQANERDFETWFSKQSKTLLWRVGDVVDQRLATYAAARDRPAAGTGDRVPPSEALVSAQRRLRIGWLVSGAIWFVLTGVVVVIGLLRSNGTLIVPAGRTVGIVAALLAAEIITLALINHVFFRAVRRYEGAVDEEVALQRTIGSKRVHAGQQYSRWALMRTALADWTVITSRLLRAPWSRVPQDFTPLPDEVIMALPASMGVARIPDNGMRNRQSILLEGYQVVYEAGWASEYFDHAHEVWEEDEGLIVQSGDRAVDLDVLDSSLSPRRRFREFWTSGRAADDASIRLKHAIQRAVDRGGIDIPHQLVRRLGPLADDVAVSEEEWFGATLADSTLFAQDLFRPAALQQRLHYVLESTAWVPGADVESSSHLSVRPVEGRVAVRVDRSRQVRAEMLTVFAESTNPQTELGPIDLPVSDSQVEMEKGFY